MEITKISLHGLTKLSHRFPTVTITKECAFVYENQTPIGGIILLEGKALLTSKKKVTVVLRSGMVYGLKEFLQDIPVNFQCTILKKSRIIVLFRSDISKLMEEKENSYLRKILSI